jgi:L-ascorbate metabolism protein UlaG (beta-lactamase superfamily)
VLADYPADTIYLGAGAAGHETEAWRNSYWDETVVATGASTVLPVHWDRFWRPLSEPLKPLPSKLDNLDATLATWMARANASRIDLRLPKPFVWEQLEV